MIPFLILLALASAAGAAEPGPLADRFGALGNHAFLVVDLADGRVLRADDRAACHDRLVPWGTGTRFLAALAALEGGSVDPERVVACDDRCWADGGHGDVTLVTALAWECDTALADLPEGNVVAAQAEALGLRSGDDACSPAEWAAFWTSLGRGGSGLAPGTISYFQAAAGIAVTSPRGTVRSLHDPRLSVRAVAGENDGGAWVSGLAWVPGGRRWAFALHVPEATLALATARADHLLDETVRAYRLSTRERGGEPWPGWVRE